MKIIAVNAVGLHGRTPKGGDGVHEELAMTSDRESFDCYE